jgi:hypothetical protein
MKKILQIIVVIFLFSVVTYAADTVSSSTKSNPAKANVIRTTKMHATGKVIEITDSLIKIERTVKGDIETMEFALEKPVAGVVADDWVKISYTEKDGTLTASKVSRVNIKKKK